MRKSGFEDAWIASLYKKGINPAEQGLIDQATELAKRDLAQVCRRTCYWTDTCLY
jgi:hypothetical protein